MKPICFLFVLMLLLAACSTPPTVAPTELPAATFTSAVRSSTETPRPPLPTETALPPTATSTITPLPPTETPLPNCVTILYAEYAQVEIIDLAGRRVLVDVYDPAKLSNPVNENDILLTTHTHWDHWNEAFQGKFPGAQLFAQTGALEAPGIYIQGLASAHNQGDAFKPEGGTNYIYLIEIGGLRIAHLGDIGQMALTEEQLTVLGQVDIAISQLHNPYSEMDAQNAKGIRLLNQVRPRLVIPTHLNLDTVKLATAQWPGFFVESANLQICASQLSQNGTQLLLMGEAVDTMIKYVELMAWGAR